MGDAADDLLLLAGWREGREPAWAETVRGIRARGEPLSRGDLAVTGDDLRALGIPPGPRLGEILGALLELVLERPELNRRELLLQRATELA